MSRYFTFHTGHFPNNSAFVEVTDDDRWIHHMDGGEAIEDTDVKKKRPYLNGALRYVENGMWIEITNRIDQFRADLVTRGVPQTTADFW
jgi:hypothetical protein